MSTTGTAMTTDPSARARRATPRLAMSALEWRLGMITVLATAYVATWLTLGSPGGELPAEPSSTPEPPEPAIVAAAPRVVWIDALPSAERPAFVVPAGWELASREVAPSRPAALSRSSLLSRERVTPVRARARRVRTRSS